MYWISCVLGTARQARSTVLFANQLPKGIIYEKFLIGIGGTEPNV